MCNFFQAFYNTFRCRRCSNGRVIVDDNIVMCIDCYKEDDAEIFRTANKYTEDLYRQCEFRLLNMN